MVLNMRIFAKGAEAVLYKGKLFGIPILVKSRLEKRYRIPQIDENLRKHRTRKEAILLHRAKACGVRCPYVFYVGKFDIVMEFLKGRLMRDSRITPSITREVGEYLAKLHRGGIIHGDYTPANILVGKEIAVIDFGLGSFSTDIEDRATDVLLMKKSIPENMFRAFLDGYSINADIQLILRQVEEIEKRGRYVVRKMAEG
ncbi:MAG: KEOPS complex kinase/ATPase Bud32 [Candidatus Micrarchaeia archaeon]